MVRQVHGESVESVCNCRTGDAPCFVIGSEHEVIDQKLLSSLEKFGESRRPIFGFKAVLFVNSYPGKTLPPTRQLVAAPRKLLLSCKQIEPCREPFLP